MSDKYNGWTNYETWNVALWIDNDAYLQETFAARAQELVDDAASEISGPGDVKECRHDCVSTLADEIEALVDDPEGGFSYLPDTGLYCDLLTHALGRVEWREIAQHCLADVVPTAED